MYLLAMSVFVSIHHYLRSKCKETIQKFADVCTELRMYSNLKWESARRLFLYSRNLFFRELKTKCYLTQCL